MKPRGAFRIVILAIITLMCMALAAPIYGSDMIFASGQSALGIPFQLDDQIYLRVSVNGSRPLSFLLDTGATHTILSLRNAQSVGMGLQMLERVNGGIGAERPDAYLAKDAVSISL